jgi:5'-nucleotidase (lipoprotein e(P4) family)
MALAWKQTAAEYDALYYQGFNLATDRVKQAIQARPASTTRDRPLAIITDLDDTLLDTRGYWRALVADGLELFDDARWDAWVAGNGPVASPGAIEFLQFCHMANVRVFVVTSRDQGGSTFDIAMANIQAAGLPYVEPDHLTLVMGGSSNKEPLQAEIVRTHQVVAFLGDNLNDFARAYYLTNVTDRRSRMAQDQAEFGRKFILFPNPTDGHWIRAIAGDSEPAPTKETREALRRAASGK